jgi:GNAT superfamily N-acetyltransferase
VLGESIIDQYRDFESMADILTLQYTDIEPENALVAEDDGRVVGYLFACRDVRSVRSPLLIALRHVFLRGVCFRPGTIRFYLRSLIDLFVLLVTPRRPRIDARRYQSHTHTNFARGFRGGGVSTEMHAHLFDRLKAEGVTGMQAEVIAENTATLRWVQNKLGYRPIGEPYYAMGIRDHQGKRLRIQAIISELDEWEIGAWKREEPLTALPSHQRATG